MASSTISDETDATRPAALIALAAGILAALLILFVVHSVVVAAAFAGAALVVLGGLLAWRRLAPERADAGDQATDWALVHAIAAGSDEPVAVTDRAGRMVCANDAYQLAFGGLPTPPSLPVDETAVTALGAAGRAAWRDGAATVARIETRDGALALTVTRAGVQDDMLVWRFATTGGDTIGRIATIIAGATGDRLGAAGIMLALVTVEGQMLGANRVFRARAIGPADDDVAGREFAAYLRTDAQGHIRFATEGTGGVPLRVVQLPFAEGDDAPLLVALLDEEERPAALAGDGGDHVRALVALMPFGMALIDREGRFAQMNDAFARAAGVDPAAPPLYPGDLVVREDKAAVADGVRRFAGGATHSADMAVRLKGRPDDPVALTIAGARGLGGAAVLLSLKDNSEETRLKRQAEQATKMQAVGQLAGGVAHDFNNILTAIIGHCDLMLMRHSPGDSDYDDIQQIRTNSNRAAGLTRQLLAFSRQQTLRPQVLQLPDVVAEVSNLLKRLMGETVTLDVHHGRSLGPVRADPGQLEQVVVNLAVNARDAMLARHPSGGGTLTIQTRAVAAAEVRALGHAILPVGDYTTLEISDTGTGIPADVLPKIFEPFFTTKEVGKGTGLGLATVYGIVKQSGGYIFADSRPGQGATFTIYLPVHTAGPARATKAPPREPAAPAWGSGLVLLVEDEDMVRAVAERALTRQGYTVITAENGEAALELLATSERPDLMVSDVVMPTMDGPTTARHVRERYPDLPILFMSGYAEEQLRKSIDLDNVGFLPKPFSVQQLAQAASQAMAAR